MSTPSSSGSGTGSKALTSRPLEVFSVGNSGLVMPISLRYASAANDTRLACWFFQPNRPTRGSPVGLEHGRERDGAAQGRRLILANPQERRVGDRFDEAGAERVRRDAERADGVFVDDGLDDVRVRRARMHERTAERLEELVAHEPARAVLGDLAGAAGHDVLMTLAATLRVIDRAQSVRDYFDFLEDEAVIVERAQRHDIVLVDRLERAGPAVESRSSRCRTRWALR